MAQTESQMRMEMAGDALGHIAAGWRADWSDFDGRSLRGQLDDVAKILKPETSLEAARAIVEEAEEFKAAKSEFL